MGWVKNKPVFLQAIKLTEISKLLLVITSSEQGRGLGSFLSFSSEKAKFLPELNLLVENFYLFINK